MKGRNSRDGTANHVYIVCATQIRWRSSGGRKVMAIQWMRDVDGALVEARVKQQPLLLDFSAAPA